MLSAQDINYWAVLVAAVINMVVGATWYSPMVFGKAWAKLSGQKMEDMKATPSYVVTTVAALVQAWLLAVLVHSLGLITAMHGLTLGLLVWAGFVATTSLGDTVFGDRPFKLWQLNNGYYLVVLVINSIVLSVWH